MRKALFTVAVAASITFAVWEVVAASGAPKGFHYVTPTATIHVAVPAGTKGFSTDLLPQ